jgi:hypothetical protein
MGIRIIDAEPSATISTIKLQHSEPGRPKEGEHLFHSQMWVKGTLLHFIVDSGSQKNLISAKVIKWLALPTMPHPQPYTIGWLQQGSDLHISQQSLLHIVKILTFYLRRYGQNCPYCRKIEEI